MYQKVFVLSTLSFIFAIAPNPYSDSYPIFYVSPIGNDTWSGTLPEPLPDMSDGPFNTLEKARDALRQEIAKREKKGGVILIRQGNYFLSSPLELNEADSGSEEFPVLWQNYKGETVKIIGGKEINNLETYQGNIYKTTIEKPQSEPRILLFNDKIQTLARWPNKSEEQLPGGAWAFITNVIPENAKHAFQCSLLPSIFANTEVSPLEIATFSNYNWAFQIIKIKSIDMNTHTIEIDGEFNYEAKKGRRFFLQNHLSLLDDEGEWYFDSNKNELYYYPPLREQSTEKNYILATLNNLIQIKNARYINIIGINFIGSNDTGIVINNSEHCLIAKSSLSGIYRSAISINGGKNNRVEGCDLFELGGSGISVNGGDKKTLTPGGHQIINNHIYNFAQIFKTYHPAISINGVSNRIANNDIHDSPHSAIILGGNDHIIEYNRIYRVCQETGDAGAFYMGRDWTNRGNILRYNIFHDVYGFGLGHEDSLEGDFSFQYESPLWAWGIYLDDCTSGVTVYGNIIYRVPLCGVMIGGGRDNLVENNIFVDCIPAVHIDARWETYCWDVMDERLEAMKPKEPPYSTRYPELLSLYQDDRKKPTNNRVFRNIISYERDDFCGISNMATEKESAVIYHLSPFDPETNKFDFNLIYHFGKEVRVAWQSYKKNDSEKIPFSKWQERGFDNSSIIAKPFFLYPEKDDYWLEIRSLALKNLKFQQIPIDKIGCYFNEFRRTWPVEKPKPQKLKNRKIWKVKIEDNEFKVSTEEIMPLKQEEQQAPFDIEKFVEPFLSPGGVPLEQAPIPVQTPSGPSGIGGDGSSFDPMKSLPPFPQPK
ncbi:MAG TPA: right-handed parallel beta-helix repeat-containing protein [Candidatus Hydrogenedens sp.]|nr:right-handed parallel beta-helix repeat-containing protein [Candidatus Hydrogenedens sp.]HPP57959.1 right-handed parallel beta-helix repeat-containing protein [Candidatus Hydrogenedens sp.]